ncbi:hypothetical protein DL98DRAFT_587495 [Cadophora sp. DSE1049]|nr:hypothetical protein DL98DRAFT_587495 [Cadophora sp. DSE1049]
MHRHKAEKVNASKRSLLQCRGQSSFVLEGDVPADWLLSSAELGGIAAASEATNASNQRQCLDMTASASPPELGEASSISTPASGVDKSRIVSNTNPYEFSTPEAIGTICVKGAASSDKRLENGMLQNVTRRKRQPKPSNLSIRICSNLLPIRDKCRAHTNFSHYRVQRNREFDIGISI